MAWRQLDSYSFGFSQSTKKFWLYYTLKGGNTATQVFLTPTQFHATVAAFNAATAIQYEDVGKFFTTQPRQLP